MRKLITVLALVVLVSAACSKGTSGPTGVAPDLTRTSDPVKLIAASGDAAGKARTARMTMAISFPFGGQGNLELTGSGSLNFKRGIGEFTFDLASLFESFGDPPPGVPTKIRMIFTDSLVYMKIPKGAGNLPRGKTWIYIDAKSFAKGSATGSGFFGTSDPSGFFDMLSGVTDDVKELGPATIRGVPTVQYRVVVDVDKAIRKQPKAEREVLRQQTKDWGKKLPMNVWIGRDDGLVYKEAFETEDPSGNTVSIEAEIYDYGQPIVINIPSKADIHRVDSPADFAGVFGG